MYYASDRIDELFKTAIAIGTDKHNEPNKHPPIRVEVLFEGNSTCPADLYLSGFNNRGYVVWRVDLQVGHRVRTNHLHTISI